MAADNGLVTVGIAGDWHGNTRWAQHALTQFHRAGVSDVWHLGDFGFWPGGGRYLDAVQDTCAQLSLAIFVTPGNHEDYSKLPAEPGVCAQVRERITFWPRGHRLGVNGWRIMSFGGAPSIDFELRQEGVSWWPAELASEQDVDAAIAAGPCDILLLHDSPDTPYATGAVRAILSSPGGWTDRGLAYARLGRARVTRLHAGLRPRLTLHGHYHVADTAAHSDGSVTVSLAADGHDANLGFLRLPARQDVAPGGLQPDTPSPQFSFWSAGGQAPGIDAAR